MCSLMTSIWVKSEGADQWNPRRLSLLTLNQWSNWKRGGLRGIKVILRIKYLRMAWRPKTWSNWKTCIMKLVEFLSHRSLQSTILQNMHLQKLLAIFLQSLASTVPSVWVLLNLAFGNLMWLLCQALMPLACKKARFLSWESRFPTK